MRRTGIAAALATALAAGFAFNAVPAGAAVSSATINQTTATLNLDGADDNETISVANGLLVHSSANAPLNSSADWDTATQGDQTVPANGTFTVVVNGGAGNDIVTVLARVGEVASATVNGDVGDDVLTGADTADTLNGGDGNDRVIGAKGNDTLNGGAGNDTLVWNNGDNTDVANGDAGNDGVEVNGHPTLGDVFTMQAAAGRVEFKRTNLVTFTIDASVERFQVNGLGGDDSLTATDGIGALTLLSVDGGTGNDTIVGADGADLILGGEGNDVLSGGSGDDRVVGDRGTDTLNGGAGDDTLVWNNGDGTDVANGDAGRDDVEVNGAPAAGDIFTVAPNGARIRFDRTNLVPFTIDIGSSESLHANGLGGNDTISIGAVGPYAVTAAGGSGDDTLTGGSSSESLLGGSGNDTISASGGNDVVSGDEGDDHVDVRDSATDVAHGGDGDDSVVADRVDALDGFEHVDVSGAAANPPTSVGPPATVPAVTVASTAVVSPSPTDVGTPSSSAPRAVTIARGTVKVINGIASIRVSCPAGAPTDCTGSVLLRTAKAVKLAGRTRVVRLGSVRYTLAAGASRTLRVRLAKGVRRFADRNGHVAILAIATTDARPTASSSRRATLALGYRR